MTATQTRLSGALGTGEVGTSTPQVKGPAGSSSTEFASALAAVDPVTELRSAVKRIESTSAVLPAGPGGASARLAFDAHSHRGAKKHDQSALAGFNGEIAAVLPQNIAMTKAEGAKADDRRAPEAKPGGGSAHLNATSTHRAAAGTHEQTTSSAAHTATHARSEHLSAAAAAPAPSGRMQNASETPRAGTGIGAVSATGNPAATRAQAPASAVPAPPRVSRLSDLAAVVRTTIRAAAGEGKAAATIQFHPQELGSIMIRLNYDGGTVTATVHAQSAEAAAVLQQGADDLRRGLEAQGLQLAGLEIRQDMSDPGANPGQGSAGGFVAGPRGTAPSDDSTEITIDPSRVPLDGSQLDVLA